MKAPGLHITHDENGLDNPMLPAVMQALYDSEINCQISCFWDGGWDFKLGDKHNGFVDVATFDSLIEGARWLRKAAVEHYPGSHFAALYRGMKEG